MAAAFGTAQLVQKKHGHFAGQRGCLSYKHEGLTNKELTSRPKNGFHMGI